MSLLIQQEIQGA